MGYNKKKNNFWHRLNSSEEFAAKVKSLKNIVTNRYFQAASLGLLGVVYYWSTKSGQWELETAHMKNGYPMMAIEKISEDERLKLAFGGRLSFEKFMHEGDDNVWNDAEGDGHAQCVFKVNGENEAFGYVLLEAQQPCSTFQWELSRVYLHFFKDERSKPLHIQVMNVLSQADDLQLQTDSI